MTCFYESYLKNKDLEDIRNGIDNLLSNKRCKCYKKIWKEAEGQSKQLFDKICPYRHTLKSCRSIFSYFTNAKKRVIIISREEGITMKKQFDKILKTSLLSWLVFIVLGLFLVLKAELTLTIISYVVGGTLLLAIVPLAKQLLSKEATYGSLSFISQIFMVVAGFIIIINTSLIASIIPVFIGILMIVNGVSKLQFAYLLRRENIKNWTFTLILSIFILAGGILFLTNPFRGAVAITKLIGIFMIVYSIIDMIDFLIIHKEIKDFRETISDFVPSKNIKIIEEEK